MRQGAGIANFMRQLGGAFGINLMVAFFEVRTRFHADALTATQDWGNHTTERLLQLVEQLLQRAACPTSSRRPAPTNISAGCCIAEAQDAGLLRHFHRGRRGGAGALIPAAMLSRSQRKVFRTARLRRA